MLQKQEIRPKGPEDENGCELILARRDGYHRLNGGSETRNQKSAVDVDGSEEGARFIRIVAHGSLPQPVMDSPNGQANEQQCRAMAMSESVLYPVPIPILRIMVTSRTEPPPNMMESEMSDTPLM